MAFARDVYAAAGAQTDFTITFAYQAEEDVLVYVNGTLKTVTTDYSFPVSTTIRLVVASTAGDHVVVQRKTSQSARDVDFTPGALTEADLDNSAIRAFYMAQEALDISGTKLGLLATSGAVWDGQSKRITLVTDPTGDQDAATKSYVDAAAAGTLGTPLSIANGGTASSTAADARTALGLYSTTEVDSADTAAIATAAAAALALVDDLSGVSDSSTALDNLGAGTTGKAIFADTTAAAVRTEIGAQADVITTQGDIITGSSGPAAQRVALGATGESLVSDGTDAVWGNPSAGLTGDAKNLILTENVGTPASKVDIDCDEIVVKTADGGNAKVLSSVNLTVDIGASGVNGLDTGAEATSTWYYIWVIWNGTTTASLLSLSSSAPTMPSGYTYKALVGSVFNAADDDFQVFYQRGKKVYYADSGTGEIAVLLNGAATTITAVDLSAVIPPNAVEVTVLGFFDSDNAAGNDWGQLHFTTTDASRVTKWESSPHTTTVLNTSHQVQCPIFLASNIYYKVGTNTGETLTLIIVGWELP